MYSSLSVVPSRTGNVFHGGGDMGNMDAEAERAKVQVDNVQKEMPDVQSEVQNGVFRMAWMALSIV